MTSCSLLLFSVWLSVLCLYYLLRTLLCDSTYFSRGPVPLMPPQTPSSPLPALWWHWLVSNICLLSKSLHLTLLFLYADLRTEWTFALHILLGRRHSTLLWCYWIGDKNASGMIIYPHRLSLRERDVLSCSVPTYLLRKKIKFPSSINLGSVMKILCSYRRVGKQFALYSFVF